MDVREHPEVALGVAVGGVLPLLVAGLLVGLREQLSNANVALVLVLAVVVAAVLGGRVGGVVAAVVAVLSFDFFHTIPYLSLAIDSRDDVETAALLLAVGLVVGTVASRSWRQRASVEAGRSEIDRIHRVAELVANGAGTAEVVRVAERELTELMGLAACRFEAGVAHAPPGLPVLERPGWVSGVRRYRATREGFELPARGVELAVLHRGRPVGRFVLTPTPGVGVPLEQRVVAVALADQVGAVVGADPPAPWGRSTGEREASDG